MRTKLSICMHGMILQVYGYQIKEVCKSRDTFVLPRFGDNLPRKPQEKHWHMVNIPSQDVCEYNACNAAFSLPHVGYPNSFQAIDFQS